MLTKEGIRVSRQCICPASSTSTALCNRSMALARGAWITRSTINVHGCGGWGWVESAHAINLLQSTVAESPFFYVHAIKNRFYPTTRYSSSSLPLYLLSPFRSSKSQERSFRGTRPATLSSLSLSGRLGRQSSNDQVFQLSDLLAQHGQVGNILEHALMNQIPPISQGLQLWRIQCHPLGLPL